MRNYWLRILFGAVAIFAVGMVGVTLGRQGMGRVRGVVEGSGPITLPIPFVAPVCTALSLVYYTGVVVGGGDAERKAKEAQTAYEVTPACIAQCPSTQRSGGQGTTRLVIDVLKSSGTFPVFYQMYTNPDELTILYEGGVIFSTGGLVSGSRRVNVAFRGTAKIIEAIVNAPNAGTAWDVDIGCAI